MTNSRDTKQPLDIINEGSTMDRFMDLSRRLIAVDREEILRKEKEYKEEQKINKRKKLKEGK